ncbi:cysteine--tRNA ligase [Candidatus Woesearchaeota archaeon CG_4_10_14_0_2_um_filter_33_10]|nr:MAG: cysteine--tRNA ligase [Candidatus Woesearchaeota archaeon CG1_02_33_12]PIN78993.1 MAG: cysteine--tRNA ligase [Candidatus Woesearchaeota archaeon CG10_big_fil_rev_8_21_14_0_10_33_12]PIU72605.1 MAG: cysteine--tRNA ligase [Candidatus Woesearchaeota archaeon CG06_land_8_20_14_3_00_33_13]PIZ52256.1 MAG: cysteine--tRNA ligase [Candidatus Woesearchaeota archaeon CG_4_10_14_0_2_um_filter_33_10]
MSLKLYNTLTRKKEEFKEIKKGYVNIYSCGPTVYNFAHIGNFRANIFADLIRRYIKYKGYKLTHVMNITDVDDKTIRDSKKENLSLKEFTEKYTKYFFDDLKTLNIEKVEVYPRATEHIKEMINLIKKLLEKGYAYKADDAIYYDIKKFKEYGKLSHLKISELKAGARVCQDEYDKEHVNDFALWKFWDKEDGDVFWETELGKGRPGWHIECSAMSMKYLGETFDIHTGGVDLIFPHHENEIAQSEAATGKKFVNYWLHNEHLLVDSKKMSKSLGNFYTLRDLLKKGYSPRSIRYVLMATHYRQKMNFSFEGLNAADNAINRLDEFMAKLDNIKGDRHNPKISELIEKVKSDFEDAMDDDLNVSIALSVMFDFMKKINTFIMNDKMSRKDAEKAIALMYDFDSVFGILKKEEKKEEINKEIKQLIEKRQEARKNNDYELADKIRDQLKEKGIILKDTKDGVRLEKITTSK